jgi:hypothetical protein
VQTQNGGDENQNLHGRDGPFPMLTDEEQTMRKRMTETKQSYT